MILTGIFALTGLLAVSRAQLQCHPETLTYSYVNDIYLWGSVEQHFRVSCAVDIDCEGESRLSTDVLAFDYIVHVYNVTVMTHRVQPNSASKLCTQTQDSESSCTVGDNSTKPTDSPDVIARARDEFALPVRFTQDHTGKMLRVEFMESDFENHEVINMKKGIISSLQTRITASPQTYSSVQETDSTGLHTSHYRSHKHGENVKIEKSYSVEDGSPRSRLTKVSQVLVKTEALVQNGEVIDSKGEVTSKMADDEEPDEFSPDDVMVDLNMDQLLESRSKFDLRLSMRSERSPSRRKRMADYRGRSFLPSSLKMDSPDDNIEFKYGQLTELYRDLSEVQFPELIQKFMSSGDENYLSLIKKIIILESEVGFSKVQQRFIGVQGPLVDRLVLTTHGIMSSCGNTWDKCRDILELYTIGGGRMAEEVFEFLLSNDANLTDDQQVDLTNLASFMTNPSDRFVVSMIHLLNQMAEDSDGFSSLLLALGSLAGQASVSDRTKQIVIAIILKQLDAINPQQCSEDVRYSDALEAIGNMGDPRFLERLMEVNLACPRNTVMRVALIHSMRNMLEHPQVQSLLMDTLSTFACEVSEDMINLLLDEIQQLLLDDKNSDKWPLTGFNAFDQALSWMLRFTPERLQCLRSQAIRYFRNKLSPEAKEVMDTLTTTDQANNSQHVIRKRAIKKHSSCTKWSDFGGRYKSIQSASKFKSDTKTYKKRKHCLAHFGIGPSKANINVYAAFFAGFTKPSKCKLFAKVVASGKVFKKSFTIATVYLYFNTNGASKKGRVYAKVGKKTLLDKTLKVPKYKASKKLYSSPTIKIPLTKIPIFTATINVNLQLSAKVKQTTQLKSCGSDLCLTYKPKAIATAAGSASINLKLIRGGAKLNLNLNYFIEGEARARKTKLPCVTLSHGRDKNTINLEFYYQVKGKVKVKVKLWPPKFKVEWKWGKKKTWKPSSLKWSLGSSKKTKIFSNC